MELENCPSVWRGAFQGASKGASVVLEAEATADLHIAYVFVVIPGCKTTWISKMHPRW